MPNRFDKPLSAVVVGHDEANDTARKSLTSWWSPPGTNKLLRSGQLFAMLAVLVASVPMHGAAAATPIVLKDAKGLAACLVTIAGPAQANLVYVDVKAPSSPPSTLANRLPSAARDFSNRPIDVFLVPSPSKNRVPTKLPQVRPLTIASALSRPTIPGMLNFDLFLRVTYPRSVLLSGIDIVAQRSATTASGQVITTETRCRIASADAAKWR